MNASIDMLHIALLLIAFALIGVWWMEAREVHRLRRLIGEIARAKASTIPTPLNSEEFRKALSGHILDKPGQITGKEQK